MKPLTLKEMKRHNKSERCHICFKPFKEDDPKVRDHCHYTARYRGPAHMTCNLQYKIPSYIPIVFHDLSRYDAHLFIKELASYADEYFCMNCLQGFKEESSRDEHIGYCIDNESVKVEMPHKNPIVQYSDGQLQFKVPFVMYADFESILEPIQGPGNNPTILSARGINNHVPSGWCVHSEFAYGNVQNPLKLYRGGDCVKKFCDHIVGEARRFYQSFPEKSMKPLTPRKWIDTRDWKGATFALSCSKKLQRTSSYKVKFAV